MRRISEDEVVVRRIWPLLCALCDGQGFNERIIDGLFYVEKHIPEGQSIADKEWSKRIKKVGANALLEASGKASAFFAKGGAKVWAAGIVEAVNKGCQKKLVLAE